MGKGKHLKAAERACSGKARFESALEAERTSEWRYRAYICPVCHHYHLTSRPGAMETQPEAPPADPKGPKLADLDWSAALNPQPKVRVPRTVKAPKPPVNPPIPPPPPPVLARCAGPVGKDRRVRLVLAGKLVKSAPVDAKLTIQLREGIDVEVEVSSQPPVVLRTASGAS